MAKVSIQIVTWNSLNYIFDCLESLMRQSFRDFSVLVIDNGSDDGTVEFIRSNYPTVSILQNFKNTGFCKANNQGILLAKSEYVLVVNPDVILDQNYLQNLVTFADQCPKGASFGGKILKIHSEAFDLNEESGLREVVKSDVIDSVGFKIFKSRRVVDWGEGEKDQGQYDKVQEVFGNTGACVLYRQSALQDIVIKNEFFDNDFFAYKEDIDIAWHFRLSGWQCWYCPTAICYHHRQFPGAGENLIKNFKHRRAVSKVLRSLSLRNYHLMLVKNDQWSNVVMSLPWFLFRELKIVIYALILEPFQYQTLVEFFKLLPSALRKRKVIMAHKKVSAKEMRKWFK
ncbi:MAG: glycosyltransferase family 2 protein [Candidatus Buchananbacteria bacterium]